MKPENSTISQPVQEGVQSPAHHPLLAAVSIISLSASDTFETLNEKFQAITTPCPHCQQKSLETAYQPPMIPGKQGYNITHCKNPQCHHYGLTMRHERFMEGK